MELGALEPALALEGGVKAVAAVVQRPDRETVRPRARSARKIVHGNVNRIASAMPLAAKTFSTVNYDLASG
jgi:hypothetical protein